MFRHEWFKIWHNRKLLAFLFALLTLNCLFFWYHAEKKEIPAHAYKALSTDLRDMGDAEAADKLSEWKSELTDILFSGAAGTARGDYPKYCENLWQERELYTLKQGEYEDILGYPAYVKKAAGAAAEYRVILSMLGGSEKKLLDVEKTGKEYERLTGLTIHQTDTKGISSALSLPSILFLEMLSAVLLVSVLFTKEKEQGLLRLYSSMREGRGRMFLTRMGAAGLGIACCNLLFFLTTLLMGCILYGMPRGTFLSEPLQSLTGYKSAVLPISIGTFLLLAYVWSCAVSFTVALLTATVSSLVSSAMKVYVILFTFVGIEGILYLKIDDLSYLSGFKRINLVSFADPGYCIARYRNEFLFGKPVGYPVMALGILVVATTVFGFLGWFLSERGYGVIAKRRNRRLFRKGISEEYSFGKHTGLVRHESVKFFRYEKIGYVLVLLLVLLLFMTKPYEKQYTSIEEMFYQSYLYRLMQAEPEQYGNTVTQFSEELDLERMTSSAGNSLHYKEEALGKIQTYVEYLETKEGARAVDSRGYEKLYKDRKQNVILGVCAVLAAILCGISAAAVEYRSGMADLIRISKERRKVLLSKGGILLGTVTVFFGMIYGRYLYQVLKGYGTAGIGERAYSLMDWAKYPAGVTVAGAIVFLYLKRYFGMLLVTAVAVLLTTRLKSFLLTAIVCLVVLAVPLLLCLTEVGAVEWLSLNWFFV